MCCWGANFSTESRICAALCKTECSLNVRTRDWEVDIDNLIIREKKRDKSTLSHGWDRNRVHAIIGSSIYQPISDVVLLSPAFCSDKCQSAGVLYDDDKTEFKVSYDKIKSSLCFHLKLNRVLLNRNLAFHAFRPFTICHQLKHVPVQR